MYNAKLQSAKWNSRIFIYNDWKFKTGIKQNL